MEVSPCCSTSTRSAKDTAYKFLRFVNSQLALTEGVAKDSILTHDDKRDGYNSNENHDRDSSRDGYQKSQPSNKRRKVLLSEDTGATYNNRGRASEARNGIRGPPFVVTDKLEDINEAPNRYSFQVVRSPGEL